MMSCRTALQCAALRRTISARHFNTCPRWFTPKQQQQETTTVSSGGQKTPQQKNPLKKVLIDKIRFSGPISVAEYMQTCSGSPGVGYYSKNDGEIFGARGDFVTSPEFTQMLGELVGVWVVSEVFKLASNNSSTAGDWQLVELGPGSGTLMHDVLGVLRKFRVTDSQFDVRLVETSPRLIGEQATILCGDDDVFLPPEPSPLTATSEETNAADLSVISKPSLFGPSIFWHHDLDHVPHKLTVAVAHEFFDALPVHKFKRTKDGWREVLIGVDDSRQNLVFTLASNMTVAHKLYLTKERELSTYQDDLEISPSAAYVATSLANRVNESGGAALLIDYGSFGNEPKTGDTLRAYRHHKQVNPLESPGSCDVTCDVDFDFLVDLLRGKATLFGPLPQSDFLLNLGLQVRFQTLLKAAQSEQEREYLQKSFDLLIDPAQMGQRFKALAIFPKSMQGVLREAPPSGFTPLS